MRETSGAMRDAEVSVENISMTERNRRGDFVKIVIEIRRV